MRHINHVYCGKGMDISIIKVAVKRESELQIPVERYKILMQILSNNMCLWYNFCRKILIGSVYFWQNSVLF